MNKMQALKQLRALMNLIEQFPEEAEIITIIAKEVSSTIQLYHGLEAVGSTLSASIEVRMEKDYLENTYNYQYQRSSIFCGEPTVEILQLERKAVSAVSNESIA